MKAFYYTSGGIGSIASGGDFFKGAVIGATVGLLNHAMHDLEGELLEKIEEGKQGTPESKQETPNNTKDKAAKAVGAAGIANDSKLLIMEKAGNLSKMGKTIGTYSKIMKWLGVGGNAYGMYTAIDESIQQYQQEGAKNLFVEHRSIYDAVINVAGTAAGVALLLSNPAGWVAGVALFSASYSTTTFFIDIANNK